MLSPRLNILAYSIRLADLPQALELVRVLCEIDYHKNSLRRRGWLLSCYDYVTFYISVGALASQSIRKTLRQLFTIPYKLSKLRKETIYDHIRRLWD